MNDDLNKIFRNSNYEFNQLEPNEGHFLRFKQKLKGSNGIKTDSNNWVWLYVAASILVVIGIFNFNKPSATIDLRDVSSNMAETQNYYTSQIQKDIKFVINHKNKSNSTLINDAFKQLAILQKDYVTLTIALNESGADQRVIHAMISNYQKRVMILNNLISRLNDVKKIKSRNNENQTI